MLHLIIKINSTFIYLYMCLVFIFNTTPEIQTPSGKNAIQVSAASIKSCRFHFKVEMTKRQGERGKEGDRTSGDSI